MLFYLVFAFYLVHFARYHSFSYAHVMCVRIMHVRNVRTHVSYVHVRVVRNAHWAEPNLA